MSVNEAEKISAVLVFENKPWNIAFDGRPVALADNQLPVIQLAGGMTLTLLSPRSRELEKLSRKWQKDLESQGRTPNMQGMTDQDRNRREVTDEDLNQADVPDEETAPTSGAGYTDFASPPTQEQIYALAAETFRSDRSVANGSSIAFLAEFEGAALLIGSDAWAEVLIDSISKLVHDRGIDRLGLTGMFVPHNGSKSSLSMPLLEIIDCPNYFFSTDGAMYRHPDPQTIARILVHRKDFGDGTTLHFNYRTEQTSIWGDEQLQRVFNYRAVFPEGDEPGLRVKL